MATVSAPLAPARWLRPPRRTARLRLTLLYSGMFLLLGTVVIVFIYLFFTGTGAVGASAVSVKPVPGYEGLRELVVPIAQNQHNADIARLLAGSWVVLALTAVGSAVLGWFISGRVLRPLREITSTARTISAGNLHERLALTGPDDEFKQLGDTLDALLARLQASFESQRRFVANASHELKTPLTADRTVLQVALADPNADAASLRVACAELLASGFEQERLLESLLTLATSERGLERREPIELSVLAADALDAIAPTAITIERRLHLAATSGDPALVERLIANLIDNAIDHNVAGGRVELTTATADGEAVLTVINTGPRVAAGDIHRLLEPFQRGDPTRAAETGGHHGLGLSIVRAIATAHDAALLVEPRTGGGLTVTVRFAGAPVTERAPAGS
jgi:signal transduction histidine kinase